MQHRLETRDVLDLLNEIEGRLDVGSMAADGFNFWPILRVQLSFQLDKLIAVPANATSRQHLRTAFRKMMQVPTEVTRWIGAGLSDRRRDGVLTDAQCLFYTYATARRFKVGGAWFDVYCDPVISALKERDITYRALEYTDHSGYRVPRYHASTLENPVLVYRLQAESYSSAPVTMSKEARRQLTAYRSLLKARSFEDLFPDERSLQFRIKIIRRFAEYFKREFTRGNTTTCFGSNYYGFREMGMNLAARESGVLSVDLQHGMQGPLHVAYGRWSNVPSGGFEVMPTVFWNWSQDDSDVIDRWASATTAHRTVVGGLPVLEMFRDEHSPLVREFDAAVQRVLDRSPNPPAKKVLLTLQTGVGINAFLREMLSVSPPEWFWWVRLHPGMMAERAGVEAVLRSIPGLRWNIEDATTLPLYSLLWYSDGHVTDSSSSVIEAAEFGVRSVVSNPSAPLMYERAFAEGNAVHPASAPEAIELIGRMHAARSAATERPRHRMAEAIDRILAMRTRT